MRLTSALRNARDIITIGPIHFNRALLRAELTTDHRVSNRRFLAEMLPKRGVGAEIGVFTGLFSAVLLDVARPAHAYFVDPWWKAHGETFPNWGSYTDGGNLSTAVAHETAVHRINSHAHGATTEVLVEFSNSFLARIPDEHLDWVYIDSFHSYEGTVSELALLRLKMKPGAIVAGDDWWDDPKHRHHGVAKAISESVERGEYQMISSFPATQWAIRVPSRELSIQAR